MRVMPGGEAPTELSSVLSLSGEARGTQAMSFSEIATPGPGLPHCRGVPTSAGTVQPQEQANQDSQGHMLLSLLSFSLVLRMLFGFLKTRKRNKSKTIVENLRCLLFLCGVEGSC